MRLSILEYGQGEAIVAMDFSDRIPAKVMCYSHSHEYSHIFKYSFRVQQRLYAL